MRNLICLTAITALTSVAAFAAFGDVVSSFPVPAVLSSCDGLTWDGAYLWGCAVGPSGVYRLTTTGSVVYSFNTGGGGYRYYYGAAYDGQYLWLCESVQSSSRTYFIRWTTTGSYVDAFTQNYFSFAGITYENGYIWHEHWPLWQKLVKYTTAGSLVASFAEPIQPHDLAWDGHYLWSTDGYPGYMYQFTTNGSIVASCPVPGGGAGTGMEFDGQYMWVVDQSGIIAGPIMAYQVDIGVTDVEGASFGKIKALYR